MWSGAICSDDAQCKQIVLSITLRERWGTTRYRANKRKVLRFILRLYLWRFCWIIHSMELYLLRTEFITLYGINITVQSTEVFILPSIFPSYKNIVKMKKKKWGTLLGLTTACPAAGHSFVLSANAIPNYPKDLSLLLSSSDWLWLHRLLPTEMPSDCIWKCCAVNVITFQSALPCQWISSRFFSKIMCMVQTFLHLSKNGKGLCHLPLVFGKGFWSANHLQILAIQSGLGLLWQKSSPDNLDL